MNIPPVTPNSHLFFTYCRRMHLSRYNVYNVCTMCVQCVYNVCTMCVQCVHRAGEYTKMLRYLELFLLPCVSDVCVCIATYFVCWDTPAFDMNIPPVMPNSRFVFTSCWWMHLSRYNVCTSCRIPVKSFTIVTWTTPVNWTRTNLKSRCMSS
jgi:hypothetical protein